MKKIIFLLICVILFCGCENRKCSPTRFKVGDTVYSRAGNHKGQVTVVRAKCVGWTNDYYTVRFNKTSGLSTIDFMNEFELKGVK